LAYRIDGSVHTGGLSNEKRVINFLNSIKYYPEEITPLGGTQHKADAIAGTKGISIKRKKSASQGSFDYLNTSQLPTSIAPYFTDVLTEAAAIRLDPSFEARLSAVDRIRARVADACSQALNDLTPELVTEFLVDALVTRYQSINLMAVTDGNKLNLYSPDDNPVVQALSAGQEFCVSGKAKGSRRVESTNLRIRITTNNGIGALLGVSKANKNSSISLKLQQDRVNALLNIVNPLVFDMEDN